MPADLDGVRAMVNLCAGFGFSRPQAFEVKRLPWLWRIAELVCRRLITAT